MGRKNIIAILLGAVWCFCSCKTTTVVNHRGGTAVKTITTNKKLENIVKTALQYGGVRYQFGGSTRKGIDCSGLVYVAFKRHQIPIERVSYKMAKQGRNIPLKKVKKGDLLFFKTNKKAKNRINHVGLVVKANKNNITFIHATSSRGVIISSLKEGYWNRAFVKAVRIL